MKLFDCNCSFGESARPPFRYARSASELLKEMDYCGIDRALVHHSGMRFGSPVIWNAQLLSGIKGHPRLEPTWAILPHQTGEQLPPKKFIAAMRENGIRSLWAFPEEHRYRLDRRTFGSLLHELVVGKIPLFVKQNIAAIGDLLADFPQLTVVAVNQGPHSIERYLRPLVEAFPRLYLDTSYYIVEGLIEEFCALYGHQRLLFGTAFPDNCSGAALLRLVQADIDDKAKSAIASGNLERILKEADV